MMVLSGYTWSHAGNSTYRSLPSAPSTSRKLRRPGEPTGTRRRNNFQKISGVTLYAIRFSMSPGPVPRPSSGSYLLVTNRDQHANYHNHFQLDHQSHFPLQVADDDNSNGLTFNNNNRHRWGNH